jgi:hypothetical protein
MNLDVKIHPASKDQPCHWCKAGFIYVADQALGTGKTFLCQPHGDQFINTFHKPEPEPRDGV